MAAHPQRSDATLRRALGALLPVALLGLLFFVDFPLCPMRHVFGVPCPGCGLTRASGALLTGRFHDVFAFHPLVPLILPLVAWMFLRMTLVSAGLLRSDSFDPLDRIPTAVWGVLVLVLLGVWIARLAGALGGHPDPIDPSQGLLGGIFLGIFG